MASPLRSFERRPSASRSLSLLGWAVLWAPGGPCLRRFYFASSLFLVRRPFVFWLPRFYAHFVSFALCLVSGEGWVMY